MGHSLVWLSLAVLFVTTTSLADDACLRPQSSHEGLAGFTQANKNLVRQAFPAFCQKPAFRYETAESCKKDKAEFLRYFSQCTDPMVIARPDSPESLLIRREQLRRIFDYELFLLSRLSPQGAGFDAAWKSFEKKWTLRLNDPALAKMDHSPLLTKDAKGQLQMRRVLLRMGPAIMSSFSNQVSADTGLTRRPGFELVKAAIFLKALKTKEGQAQALRMANGDKKVLKSVNAEAEGIFYGYFPELKLDRKLSKEALALAAQGIDLQHVSKVVFQSDPSGEPPAVPNVMARLNRILATMIGKDSDRGLRNVEERFVRSTISIQKKLDRLLDEAGDKNWRSFDDLVSLGSAVQATVPATSEGRALRAIFCHRALAEKNWDRFQQVSMLAATGTIFGGMALGIAAKTITGVAAGSRVAVATSALAARAGAFSGPAGWGLSGASVALAEKEYREVLEKSYLGHFSHAEVEVLRQHKNDAWLWSAANLLLVTPGIVAGRVSSPAASATLNRVQKVSNGVGYVWFGSMAYDFLK